MNKEKLREEWRNKHPKFIGGGGEKLDEIADYWLPVLDQQLKATLEEVVPFEKEEEDIPVPEGENIGEYRFCEGLKAKGWNACRDEIIKRIEAIKERV